MKNQNNNGSNQVNKKEKVSLKQIEIEQKKYDNLTTSYAIFFIYFGGLLLGGVFIKLILSSFFSNDEEINTLLTFLSSLLILGLYIGIPKTRQFLIEDLKRFNNNLKRNLILAIILGLAFTGITFGFQKFIFIFLTKTSDNQNVVVDQFIGKYAVFAVFSSVLFAPIMEEIVFRKGIYLAFNNDKISFIVGTVVFAGIHIISTSLASVGAKNYILLITTYLVPSLMLNIIYRYFGHNVYMTIFAHLLNNILAFILVCVAGKFIVG